ncbi:hypothetical protein Tco_0640772 [Tanacetum coccineum]
MAKRKRQQRVKGGDKIGCSPDEFSGKEQQVKGGDKIRCSPHETCFIETSEDSSTYVTRFIETSEDSSPYVTRFIETSEDPSPYVTRFIETSEDSSPYVTRFIETSEDSSPYVTRFIETSEDSSPYVTRFIETSEDSSPYVTRFIETSEDSSPYVTRFIEDSSPHEFSGKEQQVKGRDKIGCSADDGEPELLRYGTGIFTTLVYVLLHSLGDFHCPLSIISSTVFQVFKKWSDGLDSEVLSSDDIDYLKKSMREKETRILPTVQDKWVSLHQSFGLICWCDDEQLRKEFMNMNNIDFLRLGDLKFYTQT